MILKNISSNRIINIAGRLVDPQTSVFVTEDVVRQYRPLVERYYAEGVAVIVDGDGKKVPLEKLFGETAKQKKSSKPKEDNDAELAEAPKEAKPAEPPKEAKPAEAPKEAKPQKEQAEEKSKGASTRKQTSSAKGNKE